MEIKLPQVLQYIELLQTEQCAIDRWQYLHCLRVVLSSIY